MVVGAQTLERGTLPWAWLLAILIHLGFAAVLVFGVTWQRHPEPAPLEAELWADIPSPATTTAKVEPTPPAAVTPAPQPPRPLEPVPTPAPVLKPVPTPHPVETTKPVAGPDAAEIALKKKQDLKLKREHELAEQLKQERLEAIQEVKKDQDLRVAAEERRHQAEIQAQAARDARAAQVDRYKLAIINRIRGNTEVPGGVPDGLTLEVDVTILPDGDVLSPVRIVKGSGNADYDQAVIRGIMRSQPLPLPKDVELRRLFRVTHLQLRHEK